MSEKHWEALAHARRLEKTVYEAAVAAKIKIEEDTNPDHAQLAAQMVERIEKVVARRDEAGTALFRKRALLRFLKQSV